ncbi:MAG: helix-turn-helix transcriptional regulator [Clostridia bacterium]|nr:helix-turn-helix transcriptional regulator [Clostridia bacterium]
MTIGETIRALRMKKGVTQEELGRVLNITPQAVSKWENHSGNPDITMIAPLCRYFGISADELCGIQNENVREALEDAETQSSALYTRGDIAGMLSLWRKAAACFPADYAVLANQAFAEFAALHSGRLPEDENREELMKHAVALGERILANCRDEEVLAFARMPLVAEYRNGEFCHDPARAEEIARSAGDIRGSSQFLLRWALEGRAKEDNNVELAVICLSTFSDLLETADLSFWSEDSKKAVRTLSDGVSDVMNRRGL